MLRISSNIIIKAKVVCEIKCDFTALPGDTIELTHNGRTIASHKIDKETHFSKAIIFRSGNNYGGVFKEK